MNLNCPNCKNAFEVIQVDSETELTCPSCRSKVSMVSLLSINPQLSHTRSFVEEEPSEKEGDLIGRFRLERILGRGGFGTVYEAFDQRLERRVALKVPKMATMSRWQAEIFIREAQAAAQLQHPNIVSVHEVGRDGNRVFIVTELIDGMTLNDWVAAKKPDAKRTATLLAKIARALDAAHSAEIVHRDIKPRNILIDHHGEPYITDFGLAKRGNELNESITRSGQIIGTPAYMSPEQAKGKASEADGRTDIYSLGVILYEMLVGRRPYRGESDVLSEEIVRGGAPSPALADRTLPAELSAICMKAMAVMPGDRFQSGGDFANELEKFCKGLPTLTLPLTKVQSVVRKVKTNRRSLLLLFSGLLAGASILGAWWKFTSIEPDGRVWVKFKTTKPNCQVRIVRVDPDLGKIKYSEIMTPTESKLNGEDAFQIKLKPGWHIIEAYASDGSIAEVWRYIPESLNEPTPNSFLPTDWVRTGRNSIKLAPIRVFSIENRRLGSHKMIRCEGGPFEVGTNSLLQSDQLVRPFEELTMPSFYVASHEVSLAQFYQQNPEMEEIIGAGEPPEHPATGVTFLQALDYCESVGGRLCNIEEYFYAVSNGGKSKFPWGNDFDLETWNISEIGTPSTDFTSNKIFNLYSNACEWTADVSVLKFERNGETFDVFLKGQPLANDGMNDPRLVVGGTNISGIELANLSGQIFDPRLVIGQPQEQTGNGLGFRVYRSAKPRLLGANDLVEYYKRHE